MRHVQLSVLRLQSARVMMCLFAWWLDESPSPHESLTPGGQRSEAVAASSTIVPERAASRCHRSGFVSPQLPLVRPPSEILSRLNQMPPPS